MKKGTILIICLVLFILFGLVTSRTDHFVDRECGIQEYERSIYWITIESMSERNYKEYPTTRQCSDSDIRFKLASRCYLLFGCTYRDESLYEQ